MTRINVPIPGSDRTGWFDPDKAVETITDDTEWNGQNLVSIVSGDPYARETLYRTTGSRWILERRSQWQGVGDEYRFLGADDAQDWLTRNGSDDVIERYFGELPDESGPDLGGRPAVGGVISTAIGDDRLTALDQWASEHGVKRAEAIRSAIDLLIGQHATA